MVLRVDELHDPTDALVRANDFLVARPAHHNLALSILGQSRAEGLDGRYWVVQDDARVVGFALQSPPGMRVVLAGMGPDAVRALADAVAPPLPGVLGDATTAAAFAGHFGLVHHVPVVHVDPGRLYELRTVSASAPTAGEPRMATADDRELVARWLAAFAGDTNDPAAPEVTAEVERRIARGAFALWDDGGPVCLVGTRDPVAGYARIGPVYTPPEQRGRGYATACVEHQSRLLVERGSRCVLYTQLSNPTANAIYRRIGYEPIAEVLGYGFG
jgi:ribosomal protein S18 acetylase RimI-like enzyme